MHPIASSLSLLPLRCSSSLVLPLAQSCSPPPPPQVTAKFPVVEVAYTSGETVVDLRLEAFCPCVPLDDAASSMPVVVFNFTATNRTAQSVQCALLASQQNCVGWDGQSAVTSENQCPNYGGNVNTPVSAAGMTYLDMSTTALRPTDAHNGRVGLAVLPQAGDQVGLLCDAYTSQ